MFRVQNAVDCDFDVISLLKGHTDLKVFHIRNYTTEGQTDWILFYLLEIKSVKMKIDKKDRKEEEDKRLRKGWRNIKIGQ